MPVLRAFTLGAMKPVGSMIKVVNKMNSLFVKGPIKKSIFIRMYAIISSYYYVSSLFYAALYRNKFKDIKIFCFFVGYPRSGHTLVGSLLNAHKNILIAHELHALRFVMMGYRREQIYSLLVRRDRWFSRQARNWTGHSYAVPEQHQGSEKGIYVIGDKKGEGSTLLLGEHPRVLARLRETVGVPIRVIHHIRNPYDNIATIAQKDGRSLDEAIDHYFGLANTVRDVCRELGPKELLEVHHEHLIERPAETLSAIIMFVGLDTDAEYLKACKETLFAEPKRSRHSVRWSMEQLRRVSEFTREIDFLKCYSFDR